MKRNKRLTGKYQITKTLFGWKIMVEVYQTVSAFVGDESPDIKVWKRANMNDLSQLNIIHK